MSKLGGYTLFMPIPLGGKRWSPLISSSLGRFGMSIVEEYSKARDLLP
jgi:hypothetical protein